MKVIVTEIFQDKFTGEHYKVGQEVDFDNKRAKELAEKNLVKMTEAEKPKRTTKSKGGEGVCSEK